MLWRDITTTTTAKDLTKQKLSPFLTFAAIPNGSRGNSGNAEPAMPTRAVTIMGLLQVMALLGCYLLVSGFLRTWEKGLDANGLEELHRTGWYGRMSFVRSFTWLLFGIPLGMAILCVRLTRTHRDMALLGRDGILLAAAVTIAVVIYVTVSVVSASQGPPLRIRFLM
jgi:hypothetical protein